MVLTSVGCSPPPVAPESFDELTSYLMVHFDDPDPRVLQAGMTNMRTWLDANTAEVTDGYKLTGLTTEAVEAIPDQCPVEDHIGAGASFDIDYPLLEVLDVLLSHDPMDIFPGSFNYNDRIFVEDLDCFIDQICERTEYHSHIENQLPLNLTAEVWTVTQIRWVELDDGPSVLYRSWMTQPANASFSWVDVDQQYGVSTVFSVDAGMRKLEGYWVDMAESDIELPEDFALNLVVDSIIASGTKLQAYMDGLE